MLGPIYLKKDTLERYRVVKVQGGSVVYLQKETAKSSGWHDHAILLKDLSNEFTPAAADEEELDI